MIGAFPEQPATILLTREDFTPTAARRSRPLLRTVQNADDDNGVLTDHVDDNIR